jgi:hypothetical protein
VILDHMTASHLDTVPELDFGPYHDEVLLDPWPRQETGNEATQPIDISTPIFQAIVITTQSARIRPYMVRSGRRDDLIAASRHAGSTAGRGS